MTEKYICEFSENFDSAINSLDDKIAGLYLGADDYLTKPLEIYEWNSRIKALIRRRQFDGDKIVKSN
ncbi:MAG: hypothetical protein HN704_01605 [Bacteroidetes bacterium]|jgi:DNA-binding response OmpR family regulator|nr:hypothetical protein [Bacteroidota bacterium]MBT6687962.1 hypothetical protein [Bacteroidota bacterium]MBT7143301.1 hypothetical protein [Bacteroidota bacterium]MBT7490282.1 hypothetical protein [Bacteroidota bacterium]